MSKKFPTYVEVTSLYHTHLAQGVDYFQRLYWIQHKGKSGLPVYSRHDAHYLNFFYCAVIKTQQESEWDFSIFTKTMDHLIWYLLITSVVNISCVQGPVNVLRNLFFNIEALRSPGATGGRKISSLFVIWILMCNVLVMFYSGDMTSHIISPAEEQTIKSFKQLSEENYTLVIHTKLTCFSSKPP